MKYKYIEAIFSHDDLLCASVKISRSDSDMTDVDQGVRPWIAVYASNVIRGKIKFLFNKMNEIINLKMTASGGSSSPCPSALPVNPLWSLAFYTHINLNQSPWKLTTHPNDPTASCRFEGLFSSDTNQTQ